MQSNSKKETQPQNLSQLWFVILIIAAGWSRYLPLSHPELFNFTPVLALFFISGAYVKGNLSWIGPVVAVIASDLVLNPSYGAGLFEPFTLFSIFAYLGIFFLGKSIRSSKKIFPLFVGALGSALLFHGITCGFAWLMNPAYSKTVSGFWQAQFFGEPGYAPAYLFLRNSILSTLLFSGIFSWIFIKNKEKRFFIGKTVQPTKA
jgi:hypothetical protein